MSEFKPIETQEELNAILKDRLDRAEKQAEEKAKEKYGNYDELKASNDELKKQVEKLQKDLEKNTGDLAERDKNLEELQGKITGYELDAVKSRIALEEGLPIDALRRLQGATEDELKADAKELAKFYKPVAPMASSEPNAADDPDASWKKLSEGLAKKDY